MKIKVVENGAYKDDLLTIGYRVQPLNELRDVIYSDAVAHGLWEEATEYADAYASRLDPSIQRVGYTHARCLCGTGAVLREAEELQEAAETDDWTGIKEELADVVIQALSTAGYLGIDIDAWVRKKMEINRGRPWKHGK